VFSGGTGMKQNVVIAIAVLAGIATTAFVTVPFASAVQQAQKLASLAHPSNLTAPKKTAADRIKSGEINCRGCDLRGADLSHECVKNGDLSGADFSGAIAVDMCMSYANFTDVSFRNANLSGANLSHSNLARANLSGAKLSITSLKGADLSTVKGLTQAQLDRACADSETRLPEGLHAVRCS
jgi:uncharacterized protein YjbI with pentapeptide repeats